MVTSMESNTVAEEIVENKTIRIDGEGQWSEISNDHKNMSWMHCTVGHVLESCPEDHGLKFTNCQMYRMGQTNASANKTKPTGTGIDQLSVCFKKFGKN